MLIPYSVNTLTCRSPWANLAILVVNLIVFVLLLSDSVPESLVLDMILVDWSPSGLIGYQFLHGGPMHLIGNMIFLWVFGNALSGVINDLDFLASYLACGVLAGALHLVVDGSPVVGASGAIAGLLGMYLAIYPRNEITCFYWFFGFGNFELKGYYLIIGWFVWDVISAVRNVPGIASWAHVGGTVAGFGIGLLLLKLGRVYRGDYDHPTMLDLIASRAP
jgi:membrane associated rhomboid family serine protease